ncbi:hypothetical protein KFK09_012096 [Dendrobium nobile]|uniref:Secreted protein n=1 Tax=Dendrobium nobile TaxID=94219 RepID=A0A8T3BEL7_DENNO|nr:hypothetical protein KFK09_012096 [Dendrobium nobile]
MVCLVCFLGVRVVPSAHWSHSHCGTFGMRPHPLIALRLRHQALPLQLCSARCQSDESITCLHQSEGPTTLT